MRRFLFSGLIILKLFTLNLFAQASQFGKELVIAGSDSAGEPVVSTVLGNGDMVVAWNCVGIYGKIINLNSLEKQSFSINSAKEDSIRNLKLVALNGNRFALCWDVSTIDGFDYKRRIFTQIFDSTGNVQGEPVLVSADSSNLQELQDMAGLPGGNFVICWQNMVPDDSTGVIWGQIFNSTGNEIGEKFEVSTTTKSNQSNSVITGLKNGDFIICWQEVRRENDKSDIFFQKFNSEGEKIGDEVLIEPNMDGWGEGSQESPAIASFADGGFIICWKRIVISHVELNGVFAQSFNYDCLKRGNELRVQSLTDLDLGSPGIAIYQNDFFVIGWPSSYRFAPIFEMNYLNFTSSGEILGRDFTIQNRANYLSDATALETISNLKFIAAYYSRFLYEGKSYIQLICYQRPMIRALVPFSLISPKHGAVVSNHQTLKWRSASAVPKVYPEEVVYKIYIDKDPNFQNPDIFYTPDTVYTSETVGLNQTYFWKVLATNLARDSMRSTPAYWRFTVRNRAIRIPLDFSTIQEALDNSVAGDTVIVSDGTYNENIDINQKAIVVASLFIEDGDSSHIQNTIISSNESNPCVFIHGKVDSLIKLIGVTFEGGDTENVGGGILVEDFNSLEIRNCRFMNNTASKGGAIYIYGNNSVTEIYDCEFVANSATLDGAVIYFDDSKNISLKNCIFSQEGVENEASAIVFHSVEEGLLENCSFNDNSSGCIKLAKSNVSANNISVARNQLNQSGNLIEVHQMSNLSIEKSLIANNFTENGNIIDLRSQSELKFTNCNIVDNESGAEQLVTVSDSASIYFKNSIFWNNIESIEGSIRLMNESNADVIYSNIENDAFTFGIDATSSMTWRHGNLVSDPLFVDTNYFLSQDSPCIDAGDPAHSFNDPEDPNNPGFALFPAMGTLRNDMGMYGNGGVPMMPIRVEELSKESDNQMQFHLFTNYPNPFNAETMIMYNLPFAGYVEISIFDVLGRRIKTLISENKPVGRHRILWNGADNNGKLVPSGIYFYKLRTGKFSETRKLILLK